MTPDQAVHLMDAVPMPLVLIGTDERVVVANAAAETLFNRSLTGRHYITVLRHPAVLDCVETALRQGQEAKGSYPTRDGQRDVSYKIIVRPVRTQVVTGALLSLEDISHVQDTLQMRRDFVANVSHELRTPLTAVLGFIETLRGPARNDAKAQDRFLAMMSKEALRMSRLIRDLLSLSRVETEERQRPTDQVDLAAVVRSAMTSLAPVAKDQAVAVDLTCDTEDITVPGDSDLLLQVFTNLIENAIKYGGARVAILIETQRYEPVLRGPAVRVAVTDDGDGIDPLHLPRLTERFYRVDSHRSREIGGTGLGLAIVKHIVNRHRGRLRIQSEQGLGSSFTVVLPTTLKP